MTYTVLEDSISQFKVRGLRVFKTPEEALDKVTEDTIRIFTVEYDSVKNPDLLRLTIDALTQRNKYVPV